MAIGSIFAGFFVYSILSYLLVVPRITIPISIAMSTLIFGITNYYYLSSHVDTNRPKVVYSVQINSQQNDIYSREHEKEDGNSARILFVTIFVIVILISSFTFNQNFHIFIDWNEINGIQLIQLGAAIMLCFFIPGYAFVLILTKKYYINPILAVLLAYLFSILITGLIAYISALSFDIGISQSKNLFIVVYLIILALYLISISRDKFYSGISLLKKYPFHFIFISNRVIKFWNYLRLYASEILVFGSLLMLVIISTYLLYGGITIGDQWYHQGRVLLFMSGSIKEAVQSGAESFYIPPFQSALLAALTVLSGIPLVNAYASIAFLNITPLFAFYYFYTTWVPLNLKKSKIIACSLFLLSSGFGWIYLLIRNPTIPITSEQFSLDNLTRMGHLDIVRTSNFVIPNPPDFSTALIYIALPAGFILLSLIQKRFDAKFINTLTVTAISVLGIISHYEFYLFVIIGSLLPLIFKMKSRNYVYLSFLIAISIVYLLDIVTPGNFFTSAGILGFPLLHLAGLFVLLTWTIYFTREYLYKTKARFISKKTLGKFVYSNKKLNFTIVTTIIFLVAYVYLLSFIILNQLPLGTIRDHAVEGKVPWYLYPMRLGVAGLFGLAFILSYMFKRFENQVFVFGIIIVVSLIASPYYSETRFSKYVMIGMVGFASLLIYKIIIWRSGISTVRNVALIATIIISSGLSILIFIGYNSLILQTNDYISTQPRRNFPSSSELQLFESLHEMADVDSKRYNVISFPDQYDTRYDGIMLKVQSFAGLPADKLEQSPLALNASSLDALYRQLEYSDARYIVLPKSSIGFGTGITDATRFAINYFKHIYDDKNNIILEVPEINPPNQSSGQVAMVYNQDDDLILPRVSDIRLLDYNDKTFNMRKNDTFAIIKNENQTLGVTLFGSNNENVNTLWLKNISSEGKVNYIETRFRTTSEDQNKSNDVRLRWQHGDKEYYTKLSDNSLELHEKFIDNPHIKVLSQNTEIKKSDGIWYTLKIEILEHSIKVFINDLLKIQAPRDHIGENDEAISRIGLASRNSEVEFGPVKIGSIPDTDVGAYDKTKYYNYYYPLSVLALSKTKYDIFKDTDLTVFSNKVIVISDSLQLDDFAFKSYLDYIRKGGTLIALNSGDNFSGTFSRLFSIQSNENKTDSFANIAWNKNQNTLVNVPGVVKKFEVKSIPDVNLIAIYRNSNNQTIAPFALEKKFFNGGKIILINAGGYFNAISNSPTKYFSSLSNISKILPIDSDKVINSQYSSVPTKGFIGDMEAIGKITLNSSSLSLLNQDNNPYQFNTSRIKIFNNTDNRPIIFDNMSIKDLKLTGRTEIVINLTGILRLPDLESDRNYIGMLIPSDFNMTVRLYPHSSMKIVPNNNSFSKTININDSSNVYFYKVRVGPSLKFVPIILKNPEMIVDGKTRIENAYFDGYLGSSGRLRQGYDFEFQGKLRMKFDYIDHFNRPYRNGTSTQYITYLQSIDMDGNIKRHEPLLKLPGYVPFLSIKDGQNLPLLKIMSSRTNIIAFIGLIIAVVTVVWFIKKIYAR
jgi:hypothetical protein